MPGGYSPTADNIVQELPGALVGSFDTPTYYNGTIYYVGSGYGGGDTLKAFTLVNGRLSASPTQGSHTYGYPGSSPSISANGSTNGIVWTLDNGGSGSGSPSVLYAYDASNVTDQLYNSTQAGTRDQAAGAVKFTTPTVVNGHVDVGGSNAVTIYGLIPQPSSAPPAPSTFNASVVSVNHVHLAWTMPPSTQSGFKIQRSLDGTNFTDLVLAGRFGHLVRRPIRPGGADLFLPHQLDQQLRRFRPCIFQSPPRPARSISAIWRGPCRDHRFRHRPG